MFFASVGAKRAFYRESLDALLRALALSMNGGWSILAEAFAHCPPGGHDPARGAPLPAFRPVKIPVKKKGAVYRLDYTRNGKFSSLRGQPP